jgi:hypothetical protein
VGHKVLIAPQWIKEVSWSDSVVSVGMTRRAVQEASASGSALPPDRAAEARIYEHNDCTGYW